MTDHKLTSTSGPGEVLWVTPEIAGWDVLDFSVVVLDAGQTWATNTGGREVAIVPLQGAFVASVEGDQFELSRSDVFTEMAPVLYLPPGTAVEIAASSGAEFAVGGAAAEGKYPIRLIQPEEMKAEVRGGGGATRQVNHILAHPLPAERLICTRFTFRGAAGRDGLPIATTAMRTRRTWRRPTTSDSIHPMAGESIATTGSIQTSTKSSLSRTATLSWSPRDSTAAHLPPARTCTSSTTWRGPQRMNSVRYRHSSNRSTGGSMGIGMSMR